MTTSAPPKEHSTGKLGRPKHIRAGVASSVYLTQDQLDWLDAQGVSRSDTIRALIDSARSRKGDKR